MRKASGLATAGLVLGTTAGHLVYPLLLAALARRQPTRPPPVDPSTWPALTVLVPAYRESGVVGDKVADVLANGYPGDVQVLVVAEDCETADAAGRAGADVVQPESRLGKSQAINFGMELAKHDIVVISDANNRLEAGALAALVPHLSDPTIGAVAGEKVELDGGGEELYWRFESWLKQKEWDLGTTLGIVGELVATRRSTWRPIPPDISSDDLWLALDLAERGLAVAYEPAARSLDPPVESAASQWERRTRILCGALHVFWRKRHLVRRRHGLIAFEIIGHKLWRSTGGPIAHVVVILLALRRVRSSRLAALTVAGHVLGSAAFAWQNRGHKLPRLLAAGAQILYLQVVALGGMLRFVKRDRVLVWAKPAR